MGRIRVYEVTVLARIQELFAMSYEEAQLYEVRSGYFVNMQAHEDAHARIFAQRYFTMFAGYNLLYNRCVCRPCYKQWTKYIDFLDRYTKVLMKLQNSELDCDAYQNPQSCADAKQIHAGLANLKENMRLHGELLRKECPGDVVAAPQ